MSLKDDLNECEKGDEFEKTKLENINLSSPRLFSKFRNNILLYMVRIHNLSREIWRTLDAQCSSYKNPKFSKNP